MSGQERQMIQGLDPQTIENIRSAQDIPVTFTGKFQRLKLEGLFKDWQGVQFKEPRS